MRFKVLLFSKSKSTTGATLNFIKSLKRAGPVAKVKWVNFSKMKRITGKKIAKKRILNIIDSYSPTLTIVNNDDAEVKWVKKCSETGVVSCVYHEVNMPVREKAVEIGRLSDFFYLSSNFQLKEYRERGVDAVFLCRGSSPDVHYPVRPRGGRYESEVAFIGKPRAGIRNGILRKVNELFDLKVWGPRWDSGQFKRVGPRIGPSKYRIVCSSAKIILGINDAGAADFNQMRKYSGFTSNRDRITMGCGGFLLTNYNRGLENIFKPGKHLEVYGDFNELKEKISYYLKESQKRSEIAYDGCTYIHSAHTFDHFTGKLIEDARNKFKEKAGLFSP